MTTKLRAAPTTRAVRAKPLTGPTTLPRFGPRAGPSLISLVASP